MSIRQLCQGKSGGSDIEALHVEGSLDRDRVDFNEELFDQRKGFKLELFGLLISSLQAVHDEVMSLSGRYIRENRDNSGAAERTEGHDLVIIS